MALKIHALHLGNLVGLSQAALTYQRGYAEQVDVPVIMFVITGGAHPVVVDTGTGTPEASLSRHGVTLDRPAAQEPLAALTSLGVDPADVLTVINTHLHWDHCSNNDLFPNARILVQRSELAYAVDPLAPNRKTYERLPGTQPSWTSTLHQIQTVTGDGEVLAGIRVIHLPGHSPGSQGVVVSTEAGSFLIAGDCVSCYANWEGDERLTHIPAGGFTDMRDYMDSFDKIEGLGVTVIPSHDPRVVARKTFG